MKKKKRLLAILLAVILSVSATACSNPIQQSGSTSETTSSKRITPEDVKERVINQATEYLKKNYPDDNFTFISAASPNWADNYYKVGFKTEKYNNQQVMVYGSSSDKKDEDGFTIYTYSDDYYQYYMKDDAEEYFSLKLKKYLENEFVIKVRFKGGIGFTKIVNNDQSFTENIKNDKFFCLVYIFLNQEFKNVDDQIEKFVKEIADDNINIDLYYIYTKQLVTISKDSTNDVFNRLKSYSIDGDIGFKYSIYNGSIDKY